MFLKIKYVIYENNLIVGKANKILLPFAKKLLVANEKLEGIPKKYSNKIYKIGNIVKEEIIYFSNFSIKILTFQRALVFLFLAVVRQLKFSRRYFLIYFTSVRVMEFF